MARRQANALKRNQILKRIMRWREEARLLQSVEVPASVAEAMKRHAPA